MNLANPCLRKEGIKRLLALVSISASESLEDDKDAATRKRNENPRSKPLCKWGTQINTLKTIAAGWTNTNLQRVQGENLKVHFAYKKIEI